MNQKMENKPDSLNQIMEPNNYHSPHYKLQNRITTMHTRTRALKKTTSLSYLFKIIFDFYKANGR